MPLTAEQEEGRVSIRAVNDTSGTAYMDFTNGMLTLWDKPSATTIPVTYLVKEGRIHFKAQSKHDL